MMIAATAQLAMERAALGLGSSWWNRLWFRDAASTFAPSTDALFFYIFWVSLAFFAPLMFLLVYWGIKYRRKPGVPAKVSPAHHTPLEITWSVVPGILMAVMFVWGAYGYLKKVVVPSDAQQITVTAKQWAWTWEYPGGIQSLETERISDVEGAVFALPRGKPTQFLMSSSDVIHSFYIPEFRIKRDVLPNRYTTTWVNPTRATHTWDAVEERAVPIDPANPGFLLFCTEYCGDQHSQMSNRVIVLEPSDYEQWLDKQADTGSIPLFDLGATLYKTQGCATCHSVDGSAGTGPTWQGIWGDDRPGSDAGKVDFNYIRQSILEPGAYLTAGYGNQMPTYQGKLQPRELLALATYIQGLTESAAADAAALSAEEMETRGEDMAPPDPERYFESDGVDAGGGG
jgi:cytochrome c oxidase subunit 2